MELVVPPELSDFRYILLKRFLDFYELKYTLTKTKESALYESIPPFLMVDDVVIGKKQVIDLIRTVFFDKSQMPLSLIEMIEEAAIEIAEYLSLHQPPELSWNAFRLKNFGSGSRFSRLKSLIHSPKIEDFVSRTRSNIIFLQSLIKCYEASERTRNNILLYIAALRDYHIFLNKKHNLFHSDHFLNDFFSDYAMKLEYTSGLPTPTIIKMRPILDKNEEPPRFLFDRMCIALMVSLSVAFVYHRQWAY